MPQVQVRSATLADFEVVTNLLAELGRPALTSENSQALRILFERYIDRPDTSPLVAEVEGSVAGFISLEFRERLNRVQPQAWIPELIVAASFRRRGVGKALLAHAIDLARERGCWSVKLESRYHRKEAHQLYRSAGMCEAGLFFLLEF